MQAITLHIISAKESAEDFYAYLKRPAWFKVYFKPALDGLRQETGGVIILAKANGHIVGQIYVDLTPKHASYGKSVPIFGWLDGDSEEIIARLLATAEDYVKDQGFAKLRGPINVPKMFGGWGVLIDRFDWDPLIDTAINRPELAHWIERAHYSRSAEYINHEVDFIFHCENKLRDIDFIAYPIPELINKHADLLKKLGNFTAKTFSTFLPDTSIGEAHMILELLGQMPNSQDFYVIAIERSTQRIVGFAVEMPNLFQLWQGIRMDSTNVNSVLVEKDYRGTDLFYLMYEILYDKLEKIGIHHHIGGTIWTENKIALACFSKFTSLRHHHIVYEKTLI